ncbi:MAG TPA: M20/M25/M40 family metallo-hydrolase [Aggregatilineales bacterium]|nr:M20/M25/M40 family metallo-hydrolase [Aggregatilineales bacterium]
MTRVAQLAAAVDNLRSAIVSEAVLREAIAIQQIAAPTFDEARRAEYVARRLTGLDSLEVDALHNVYACWPGVDRNRPAVLVCAHMDTVFDTQTPLTVQIQDGNVIAPGIGDNSLGVAGVLTLADILRKQSEPLPVDVWFVANTREEGLGNLDGMRAVYRKLAPRLGSVLVIEGMAYGRIYHAGIAVRRLEIRCTTPGGHSWLHFGRPSAIHHLVRLAAEIVALQPPATPRTTYNIGTIEGGRTVNTIASDASLLLDLRSEDCEILAALEAAVMRIVEVEHRPDVTFTVKVVGDRPAGAIPVDHPLVQMGSDVLQLLGVKPALEAGSTDANIPLSQGLPAIVVGITHGGNAHRLDEYIETQPIADGMWQLLLLTLGAANGLAES